ncbi:MAG TPA: hypothetical protein VFE62_20850 [Gemmataceae bacterium]|jgi:hypothetical protein|nr:hypothetical protein [Gemmataceae bacterium]
MFEITPEDIAQLDDKQLRTLVALLCEADLRRRGYSVAAVTWGGDQNAKDGGLDIRVDLPADKLIEGFIPKPSTGYQVKEQDLPPRAIAGEMRPGGELRPVIQELADRDGAYVIVSSKGSTADVALANRRKAMADASREVAGRIVLDFYDRTRVASWVRDHAGLIVWVRNAIGRAIPGWQPFGAWAFPAGGIESEYLLDKGVRVRDRAAKNSDDFSAEDGLKKLREVLRQPGSVVRLVGLSGVGKTRFVQALFDQRIGQDPLDPSMAVYTNMNDEPNPQPISLASDLIASGTQAILIVDNCASDLHARLAGLVRGGGAVRVITVEYDIQDDLPEGTEAFEIRAASPELIEKLLQIRFPKLSQIDARTAAEFSGGNARIAIALAETVGRSGTLSELSNKDLFERLFEQRQGQDRSLLEMAQACALVYSFDGEDVSNGNDAELFRLAGLIGSTPEAAHRDVAELLRRELAQRRGKWRAVLPHALANRLAATALENIPFARIQEWLINGAPQRLTISLARRLGYLDSSKEAKAIVGEWLGPKGWIGEHVWNLNEFGKAMFRNGLPTDPEAGLRALEANLPAHDAETPITTGEYVPRALRSLAWDGAFFERCAKLLAVLAIYGEGSAKEATEIHTSLFHLYLSGTHATAEQRAATVRRLLSSDNEKERGLGIAALDAMLECDHFSSHYDFQFGAHSRDYGYQPKTYGDLTNWYKTAFAVAQEFALSSQPAASAVRATIAGNFRGLWTRVGLRDELEAVAAKFAEQGFWKDGWLAVKLTRHYDEKDKASDNYGRLSKLEQLLGPDDLVQRARGRVFASKSFYDVDEIDADDGASFQAAMEKQQADVKALGAEVANDEAAFQKLLPEIVGGEGHLWYFGMGLAQGAKDPKQLWQRMVAQFAATPNAQRDTRALCGFLLELGQNKSPLPDELLDEALETDPLAPYFPALQAAVFITPRGMQRLSRSIELGKVPIRAYSNVHMGRAIEVVPAKDIASYIEALAKLPNGEPVAVDTLSMQFFSDRQDKRQHAPEIIEIGRILLRNMAFEERNQREDYRLQGVVEVCLAGDGGYDIAKVLCENLRQAAIDHKTYGHDHNNLLRAIFKAQPRAALNALLTGDDKAISAGASLIRHSAELQPNPMDQISEDVLFNWCQEDPEQRFPAAALVVAAFTLSPEHNPVEWTPIAFRLVHGAPNPASVMKTLIERLRPMMWSGSRSTILESNAGMLDRFDIQGNNALAVLIAAEKESLRREAREYLDWETKLDRERDERFE